MSKWISSVRTKLRVAVLLSIPVRRSFTASDEKAQDSKTGSGTPNGLSLNGVFHRAVQIECEFLAQ